MMNQSWCGNGGHPPTYGSLFKEHPTEWAQKPAISRATTPLKGVITPVTHL